jgi:hypothetical protein
MEPINTSAQTQLMILPEADKRERANLRKRQSYRIALAGF